MTTIAIALGFSVIIALVVACWPSRKPARWSCKCRKVPDGNP